MKKILFIFAGFLILFLQGCSSENSYQNFSPKNSGFVISFPEMPQEMSYPDVPTSTNIKSYFVELKNSAYFVNVRTMDKEFLRINTDVQIFDGLKILGSNTNKAGVLYENNFRLQGVPAREVIYLSQGGGQQRVRWILHNGKLYSVIVSAHGADLKSDKQAINFLNSFKLTDFAEK